MDLIGRNTGPSPNSDSSNDRMLKVDSVADICEVSKRTVYRWIHDGLPVYRMPGRGIRSIQRIDSGDLAEWLARHRHDDSEKAADERTITLEGRKFFKPKNQLAGSQLSRSRVPVKKETSR